MFLVSNVDSRRIAPALLPLAQEIEERSPGLSVFAARQFRYPVQQQKMSVRVERYRRVHLLQKFILRAYAEIFPTPSLEEVADALGLDPIFIESTLHELRESGHIISTRDGRRLTEEGKKVLSSETVSEEPMYESWYYLQDKVLGTATFVRHRLDGLDEEFEKLEDLNFYVKQDLAQFPIFGLNATEHQDQFQELGLDSHDPDQGRFVTDLAPDAPPECCWRSLAIFLLYDSLSEDENTNITFQIYSEEELVPSVGEWLEEQLLEKHFSLKLLCGLTDDDRAQEEEESQVSDDPEEQVVEERSEEIQQQATDQLHLQQGGEQALERDAGTAVQLRDVEIRPAFLGALKEAREQVIIYSPWMNEQVIDDEFLSILEGCVRRGARILIGYGIGRNERREERPVSPALMRRLHAIQTAEGTPGIIAEWLGNSHAKEIVIDRRVHFNGSQNWLSYRGDRFPRGETVYQVTIAKEVKKAHTHLAQRFIERAKTLWARAIDEARRVALCILGFLGCEQEAVAWIQRDACYHLIPLWLALVHHAIAAGQEQRISDPLREVITLCCTASALQDPLRSDIAAMLQGALKSMALKNRELTSNLVNESLPELNQLAPGHR
jgi:hypothetical protein